MLRAFGVFLGAVWVHAVTLAAGCIVTVVLGFVEKRVLKRPISLRVEIGILVAFVFFACFQAWRDQFDKVQSVTTENQLLTTKCSGLKDKVEGCMQQLAAKSTPIQLEVPQRPPERPAQLAFLPPLISTAPESPFLIAGKPSAFNLGFKSVGQFAAEKTKQTFMLQMLNTKSPIETVPEVEKIAHKEFMDFLQKVAKNPDLRKMSGTEMVVGDINWVTAFTPVLSEDDVKAIYAGDITFLIEGYAEWVDNSGKHTTTACRFSQHPTKDNPLGMIWHVCE